MGADDFVKRVDGIWNDYDHEDISYQEYIQQLNALYAQVYSKGFDDGEKSGRMQMGMGINQMQSKGG